MSQLIEHPDELTPDTKWRETVWAWTPEEQLIDHSTPARLCTAALLPFRGGEPDWEGFTAAIRWLFAAADRYGVELVPVLNADTGYIFELDERLYAEVLRRFRDAFPGQPFIAGITARGAERDTVFQPERYLPLLDIVQQYDGCEVMIMTSRGLNSLDPERRRDAYYRIAEWLVRPGIVHALEPSFVPWATPFEPWLLYQLARHPRFVGGKISTLDEPHFLYWAAMVRHLKLDFAPHSGDDFGIATAIKLGLPLLIGAASSAGPLICAAKAMWLAEARPDSSPDSRPEKRVDTRFDTRVYKLFEAIQSLEDQIFRLDERGSAAAYKHSTAHVLRALGVIAAAETHPDCRDQRGPDEAARMEEALRRPRRIAERLGIEWGG